MPITPFARLVTSSPAPLALPLGVYAGLEMTGRSVRAAVTDAETQAAAVLAIHDRFNAPALLTAMDLSAEAEAFGCTIRMDEDEIPTVTGRLVIDSAGVHALAVPQPGAARTGVHLDAARLLAVASRNMPGNPPVLGGVIGPFSLAGRLFGVSEALEATLADPDTITLLLDKAAEFLTAYALEFKQAGAAGVIMAEPAAGLLSPRGLARFSAPYVRRIIEAVQDETFGVMLHNCGARINHLNAVLESGAEVYHFGEPMDLPAALERVQSSVIIGGNLDPTAIFHGGDPASVAQATSSLLSAMRSVGGHFFLSSGCDLPPGTPVENLEAFFKTVVRGQ